MLYNYHTHTKRCNHAVGEDREYVENAIKAGIKTLGFSDHAPYYFTDTEYRSSFRMADDEINEYADSVRALKKEYAKDIDILLGFELEYYPRYHVDEMKFLNTVSPDYFILGQHFIGNETYNKQHTYYTELDVVQEYVSQTIQGLKTGNFTYMAHPDLVYPFSCETAKLKKEFTRLCEFAKKAGVPLELNLLGVREGRHYPSQTFFEIAGKVGCDIVVGFDAHDPVSFFDKNSLDKANAIIEKYNLNVLKNPFIKVKGKNV